MLQAPTLAATTLLTGQRALRFTRDDLVFTDGSKSPSGAVGCGVYGCNVGRHAIRPDAHDQQLDTVPFAELVALLCGIRACQPTQNLTLFVDSTTAMWLVEMAIHSPERLCDKKHK